VLAQKASLKIHQRGYGRLEQRLNRRGKRLAARPKHWKRTLTGEFVKDARIAELRLRGQTQKDIATSLGMSLTAVWYRLERMGFPRRARVFIHGEPVTGKHFWALCSDFNPYVGAPSFPIPGRAQGPSPYTTRLRASVDQRRQQGQKEPYI
jgi:hypothetical protein